METDIDLRQYLNVLVQRWKWLLFGLVLALIPVVAANFFLPKVYEARSAVAVVRSRTDVSFDPRIRTVSDEEFEILNRDLSNRLIALVALVEAPDVAEVVLTQVGHLLDQDRSNVPALLDMVEASNTGDVIYISVAHTDPQAAQEIANVWAEAYQEHVNRIYGARGGSNLTVIEAQVSEARTTYELAQRAVESFLADNRISYLDREIDTRLETLGSFQRARNVILSRPIDLQVQTREETLAGQYADLSEIEHWLAQARAIQDQVEAGSNSSASDASTLLALLMLQSGIYGTSASLDLHLDGSSLEQLADVRREDVEDLIGVLEQRHADTMTRIQSLQSELAGGDLVELELENAHLLNQRVASLDEEIMALQSEREVQQAEHRELEQTRDQAWDTLQTLRWKLTEEEIAAGATGTEVMVVSSAILPNDPARNLLPLLLTALVLGLLLSMFAIFTVEWWRQGNADVSESTAEPSQQEPDLLDSSSTDA